MPAISHGDSSDIASALTSVPGGTPASAVARQLLDLFTGGSIAPGTRLPAERQLATQLGVGRSAVREALAALEILGIVDVRPGSGTYLRGAASELLPQTLSWGLLIGKRTTSDLLDLRTGLEIYVARLAAGRADDAATAALAEALDRMRRAVDDPPAFARADRDFHQVLSAAASNATLVDLLHVVRSLLRVYDDRAVHDQAEIAAAVREHADVLSAMERHDAAAAASAMAEHMATATARLTQATQG